MKSGFILDIDKYCKSELEKLFSISVEIGSGIPPKARIKVSDVKQRSDVELSLDSRELSRLIDMLQSAQRIM